MFNRNSADGSLSLAKVSKLDFAYEMDFSPDGKYGFYCGAGPKNSTDCFGWFKRDADKGEINDLKAAELPPTRCHGEHGCYCMVQDTANGLIYVQSWGTPTRLFAIKTLSHTAAGAP
jgi:hypothetical protein